MTKNTLLSIAALLLLGHVSANISKEIPLEQDGKSATPLVNLGDGYYYFETNVLSNWYGARDFCRSIGLHLAAIEDEVENSLIVEYISALGNTDFWIGGSDQANPGTFVWSATGERMTFSFWHTGEPNFSSGDACVQYRFKDGQFRWNDEDPKVQLNFICERYCDNVCNLP